MKLLIILFCYSTLFYSCSKNPEPNNDSEAIVVDTLAINEGFILLEIYNSAYFKELDLFECYSLLSKECRSRLTTDELVNLQLTFETPLYQTLAKFNSWNTRATGYSKKYDSLIFDVDVKEVNTLKIVSELMVFYDPRINRDTVTWMEDKLNIYLDTSRNIPYNKISRKYLLTKSNDRFYINPANGEVFF